MHSNRTQTFDRPRDVALLSLAKWANDRPRRTAEVKLPSLDRSETSPRPSPLLAALEQLEPHQEARSDTPPLPDHPGGGEREATKAQPARQTPAIPQPSNARATGGGTRRRSFWLVPLLALVGAGTGYAIDGPAQYTARAELFLRQMPARAVGGIQMTDGLDVSEGAISHSMARATAPAVLGAVVDRLSLASNPEFAFGDRERAIRALAGRISVSAQRLTPGFAIHAVAGSAVLSGEIANAVADALIETHRPGAAGPPPTSLEVAYRAMPGTAGLGQSTYIAAAIGALAGSALGLLLALFGGRAAPRRRRPAAAAA